jgi:hypothetical protein
MGGPRGGGLLENNVKLAKKAVVHTDENLKEGRKEGGKEGR